jgi:hypothetical protein
VAAVRSTSTSAIATWWDLQTIAALPAAEPLNRISEHKDGHPVRSFPARIRSLRTSPSDVAFGLRGFARSADRGTSGTRRGEPLLLVSHGQDSEETSGSGTATIPDPS